jgi:hypothetical protein
LYPKTSQEVPLWNSLDDDYTFAGMAYRLPCSHLLLALVPEQTYLKTAHGLESAL